MAAEVAIALVVLLVAGVFYRRFAETEAVDPGFRIEGVLLAAYDLGGQGRDDEAARRFAERFLAAASSWQRWSRRPSPPRCRSTSTDCRSGPSSSKAVHAWTAGATAPPATS